MRNYIMLYRFKDKEAEDQFQNHMQQEFPHFKVDNFDGVFYFAFTAKNLPEVEDRLYDKIQSIAVNNDDYVALFYKRDENSEDFQQVMVIGHAEYMENHVNGRIGRDQHVENLQDLFETEMAPKA